MAHRSNLWDHVEKIIIQQYDTLKDVRIRGSYYIVREHLTTKLKAAEVSEEEFEHFLSAQGYKTYRDDLWPSLERQYNLERPEAKPIGVIYTDGIERPISEFDSIYYRVRGFIFVEKADEAEMLKPLSNHGWAIIAGQGFSTRLMRELFKEDGRPVLALHDCDTAGEGIARVFSDGSRRTTHLDLLLERVSDLGLSEEDAHNLNLASQPEAPKFRSVREDRVELSALNALKVRLGLDNAVLAYTIAKMKRLGIRITPAPEEVARLIRRELNNRVENAFQDLTARISALAEIPSKVAWDITDAFMSSRNLGYQVDKTEAVAVTIPDISNFSFDVEQPVKRLETVLQSELEQIRPEIMSKLDSAIKNAKIIDVDMYEEAVIQRYGCTHVSEMLGVQA